MEQESFKYYAFISYSHKDKKIASQLQKRLEGYHLPANLLKTRPKLPKNLRPVFIDESDLVAQGTLKTALQINLDRSNYLIVICSPSSAQSVYVNDEVNYFIETGKTDRIIPVIVDGTPHAEDPSLECFPPAILSLPREHELLGIDLKKFGERDTFLRVIAAILKLDIDDFISRASRERRRKFFNFVSIAAAVVLIIGVYAWYNVGHFNKLRKKAENGDVTAQFDLAKFYDSELNYDESFKWYLKAAEQGHAEAQESLGWAYEYEYGTKKDLAKSFEWYLKAAEQGNVHAQRYVGFAYSFGQGVSMDKTESFKWYMKAAEQEDDLAEFNVGEAYLEGKDVEQNYNEAVKWLQRSFNHGYDSARGYLALALKCQKAEQGDVNLQFELAENFYAESLYTESRYYDALKFYRKAAEQGHIEAQYKLGNLIFDGPLGRSSNYNDALVWWLKAAEAGHAEAQYEVAGAYYDKKNEAESFKWYLKAANQNHADAQFYLGVAYEYGEGTAKDHAKAVEWYTKAAANGNKDAQKKMNTLKAFDRLTKTASNKLEKLMAVIRKRFLKK